MASRLKKTAGTVVAPKNLFEANAMLARIGDLTRSHDLIQSAMDEGIGQFKEKMQAEAQPLSVEIETLTASLQLYAEANRDVLTKNGKLKTIKLSAGEISWRARPPSVRLKDVPAIIGTCLQRGLQKFLRIKTDIDKEAMLADPVVAGSIVGVTIASTGEDFIITPASVKLAEPVAGAAA